MNCASIAERAFWPDSQALLGKLIRVLFPHTWLLCTFCIQDNLQKLQRVYVCVCSQEDIVCEWACTIYSTRNSIAKKLNGGHFESVFDWFALSTNTIFQGTWHMAQKGRGKDNIPLCTKFENGTHTHAYIHTLIHWHTHTGDVSLLVMVVVVVGSGFCLTRMKINKFFSFPSALPPHSQSKNYTRAAALLPPPTTEQRQRQQQSQRTKTTATQRQQHRWRQEKKPVLPNWLFFWQAKLVRAVEIIHIYKMNVVNMTYMKNMKLWRI